MSPMKANLYKMEKMCKQIFIPKPVAAVCKDFLGQHSDQILLWGLFTFLPNSALYACKNWPKEHILQVAGNIAGGNKKLIILSSLLTKPWATQQGLEHIHGNYHPVCTPTCAHITNQEQTSFQSKIPNRRVKPQESKCKHHLLNSSVWA